MNRKCNYRETIIDIVYSDCTPDDPNINHVSVVRLQCPTYKNNTFVFNLMVNFVYVRLSCSCGVQSLERLV